MTKSDAQKVMNKWQAEIEEENRLKEEHQKIVSDQHKVIDALKNAPHTEEKYGNEESIESAMGMYDKELIEKISNTERAVQKKLEGMKGDTGSKSSLYNGL